MPRLTIRANQRDKGQLAVITLVPKVLTFSYWLAKQLWGLWILIGWFIKLSVQTFQPIIGIYRRGNFVYNHYICTSIYWLLSYPFRSLKKKLIKTHQELTTHATERKKKVIMILLRNILRCPRLWKQTSLWDVKLRQTSLKYRSEK